LLSEFVTQRELFNYLKEADERNQRNMESLMRLASQTIMLATEVMKKM